MTPRRALKKKQRTKLWPIAAAGLVIAGTFFLGLSMGASNNETNSQTLTYEDSSTSSLSSVSSSSNTSSYSSESSHSSTVGPSIATSNSNTSSASATTSLAPNISSAFTSSSTLDSNEQGEQEQGQEAADGPTNIDILTYFIGSERTKRLIARAKTNEDAAWIIEHANDYNLLREDIAVKALKLASDEPLATPFVRKVINPQTDILAPHYHSPAMNATSPSEQIPDTRFPHFYQWDQRWGYTTYDGDAFGFSGCGPCALAMVYQGLTGKDDLSPFDFGQLALQSNYVVSYEGTAEEFFTGIADQVGLTCEAIPNEIDAIKTALSEKKAIIVHVGPGTFSEVGHYFLLTELTKDNQVIINDPYSVERSSKLWDINTIVQETYGIYAYAAKK